MSKTSLPDRVRHYVKEALDKNKLVTIIPYVSPNNLDYYMYDVPDIYKKILTKAALPNKSDNNNNNFPTESNSNNNNTAV